MQQRGSYDRMRRIRSLHLYCKSSSLVLSNALAETSDVQASGKFAIKAVFDSCLHHLMLISIFGQQLDNEVDMLVQLTTLALVLLFDGLHPSFNMLGGNTFRPVFPELVALPVNSLRT